MLLSPAANRQIGEGRRVHPHGGVVAQQRVLPFGVDIERLGPSLVEPAEQWDIASASLGGEEADAGATTDNFAPGQFRRLTDDEQLGAPAYDRYRSGVRFVADTCEPDEDAFVTASLDWETKVVPDPNPTRLLDLLRFLRLEALVRAEITATVSLRDPIWWPAGVKLLVSHEPPVVAASTWAMTAASLPASPSATNGELRLLYAGMAGVRPVEAWEV
ncbi:hypothetical protein [Streptomyces sp. NPDC005568]|uniref:hypothetical protein n=1 Tax=Streptomyces sp. NPDC005568 TaxID=3156887 RepID=UPI0033B7F43C